MQRKLHHEKAGHSTGGHADLFWSVWISCGCGLSLPHDCPKCATCTTKPEHQITQVSWNGYNDANWWEKVAPTEQARIRTMPCGRKFEINFETREVFELIEPDFSNVSTKELVEELAKREGVIEHTVAPHAPYDVWISENWNGTAENVSETGPARILVVID